MSGDDTKDATPGEFASFLEDISEEIEKRVQPLAAALRGSEPTPVPNDRVIRDYPGVAWRMIEEIR